MKPHGLLDSFSIVSQQNIALEFVCYETICSSNTGRRKQNGCGKNQTLQRLLTGGNVRLNEAAPTHLLKHSAHSKDQRSTTQKQNSVHRWKRAQSIS